MFQRSDLTGGEVDRFLGSPIGTVDVLTVGERLKYVDIRLHLGPSMGRWSPVGLIDAARRRLGAALDACGSNEARKGQPCPWRPASAADLLFRERRKPEGGALPMPHVIRLDLAIDVPVLTLRLFGIAQFWAPAIADALVAAIRDLDGRDCVLDREIRDGISVSPPANTGPIVLEFVTPLRLRHRGTPVLSGRSLFTSLANRVAGLARWCGLELLLDWPAFDTAIQNIATSFEGREDEHHRDRRGAPDMTIEGWIGRVHIEGADPGMRGLLSIGTTTGVGGSVGLGYGRYDLI